MEKIEHLRRHGLFDAKVPRYTSYPPANHFQNGIGVMRHRDWLNAVADDAEVSVYVHIPFCKRLCWFCACRTQGTKTLRPVEAYVEILTREVRHLRAELASGVRMARLHLGGGTPTILTPEIMDQLLTAIFDAFALADDFEFSVEIDPTEASDDLLRVLADWGMNRASIGVQDFAPEVQKAIGRPQSVAETLRVIDILRSAGVPSLNFDLLYGLPQQTQTTFQQTLEHVTRMRPDRLAIYGYAHVPWMSKRQVMIKEEELPGALMRFDLAKQANDVFVGEDYLPIGIDHFALATDSLAQAAAKGRLHRNFQGYTDDNSPTLIGFGASAISRFAEGYVQNAPATSAYQERVMMTGHAGQKGYEMSRQDMLIARMVEDLMCHFALDAATLRQAYPEYGVMINDSITALQRQFDGVFDLGRDVLRIQKFARPLVRVIASYIDRFSATQVAHSTAI